MVLRTTYETRNTKRDNLLLQDDAQYYTCLSFFISLYINNIIINSSFDLHIGNFFQCSLTSRSGEMDSQLVPNALGSATAGIISRIFTHPLDTAKALLQSSGNNTLRGPLDAVMKTYRREGTRGLYRGFSAVAVGGTPATILYLCSYDIFKRSLGNEDVTTSSWFQSFSVHFASGMLAETVACIVYVPVDVIKERLQVQALQSNSAFADSATPYRGSWDALKRILLTERLSGIYKGYGATLASFGPFSAFYFVFFEKFKERARSDSSGTIQHLNDGDIPLHLLVASSASAGALASWITSPLDMAKLRLQVQRGSVAAAGNNGGKNQIIYYKNMWDCLTKVFTQDGLRGLFRGAGARVLHFAPATTITMTCYEKCRIFYTRLLLSKANDSTNKPA
jgi:hypothetical protein